jgi:hypothetical protein
VAVSSRLSVPRPTHAKGKGWWVKDLPTLRYCPNLTPLFPLSPIAIRGRPYTERGRLFEKNLSETGFFYSSQKYFLVFSTIEQDRRTASHVMVNSYDSLCKF